MKKFVWMNAWDLEGGRPGDVLDFLRSIGLDGCSLGLSYHGGRMLLAAHPSRVVFDQPASALYFNAEASRFPANLRPGISDLSALSHAFLSECERRDVFARAWVVLCHNDVLGRSAPECCVVNAFGERYLYALCPANPQVQDYCVELCRQAAAVPGVQALDLEALSFMGYEHQGLHDKRGVALNASALWWLSICCCPFCRAGCGDISGAVRERVRAWLSGNETREPGFEEAVAWRREVQRTLLARIRSEVGGVRLNVRTAPDSRFSGGKCSLSPAEMRGIADEATFTFFGSSPDTISRSVADLPAHDAMPINAGFIFHGPDCTSAEDVRRRFTAVQSADPASCGFYSYGMASVSHWEWLRGALQGDPR